jgi:hypothetical protein
LSALRLSIVLEGTAHRAQLIEHRAPHILHIQKALLQMNIQLSQAVTDVMGVTGQKIIRAIVGGERNARLLAGFRDPNCKHSEEEIEKALTGTWREEHLYVLKQSLETCAEPVEACTISTRGRSKPATKRSAASMG